MSENDQEKSEEPTQKRLEDARKKGQVAFSREVSNFSMIFALTMSVAMIVPWACRTAADRLEKYIRLSAELSLKNEALEKLIPLIVSDTFHIAGFFFMLMVIFAIIPSVAQNGLNISYDSITPKFEKISIMKGFSRMFSMRSVVEFLKGIVKIIVVGVISYVSIIHDLPKLEMTPEMGTEETLALLMHLCMKILIASTVAVFFIALADLIYQKFQHKKQLMMSMQEIKDEYKQQEGDPVIKGKLKQMRMARARQRMMQAVPGADVIITNPTHYAVALKYEHEKMSAPVVVALGKDNIALKMKEIAGEHKIPIVRNAPLARALYDQGEIDQQIPIEHFQAVAEVITYVYKLKGKKL